MRRDLPVPDSLHDIRIHYTHRSDPATNPCRFHDESAARGEVVVAPTHAGPSRPSLPPSRDTAFSASAAVSRLTRPLARRRARRRKPARPPCRDTFRAAGRGAAEIHHDQGIERVGKIPVDVASQEPAARLQYCFTRIGTPLPSLSRSAMSLERLSRPPVAACLRRGGLLADPACKAAAASPGRPVHWRDELPEIAPSDSARRHGTDC